MALLAFFFFSFLSFFFFLNFILVVSLCVFKCKFTCIPETMCLFEIRLGRTANMFTQSVVLSHSSYVISTPLPNQVAPLSLFLSSPMLSLLSS